MAVRFYMDVHIPGPITEQLRKRGVDVLTTQEDGNDRLPDPDLLERATVLGRAIFTFDLGFKLMAEKWSVEWAVVCGPVLCASIVHQPWPMHR